MSSRLWYVHNVIGSDTCTVSLALIRAQCHWLWYMHNVIGSDTCTMSSRLWYMHIGVQNSSNLTYWCHRSNLKLWLERATMSRECCYCTCLRLCPGKWRHCNRIIVNRNFDIICMVIIKVVQSWFVALVFIISKTIQIWKMCLQKY